MVLIFLFSIFQLTTISCQEIEFFNKALIWRGLEHKWTYNHRINRIGNYVTFNGKEGYSIQSSATGMGKDSSHSKTYYSYVETPDVTYQEELITIKVSGKEGDLLSVVSSENVELKEWMRGKDRYEAVLNGFELISLEKADQLQLFKIYVQKPELQKGADQLLIKSQINMVTNCRSLECEILNKKTAYEIKLPILIIGFSSQSTDATNFYKTISYDWDKSNEVQDSENQITLNGADDVFENAFVAIKGMGIVLDRQHWLLEQKSYVVPDHYDPKTGILDARISLQFTPWDEDMFHSKVAPFKAKLAKKKKGYALMDINLLMIQTSKGRVKHSETTSNQFWHGKNQNANNPVAQTVIDLSDLLRFEQ
jgi:hypothetical protein